MHTVRRLIRHYIRSPQPAVELDLARERDEALLALAAEQDAHTLTAARLAIAEADADRIAAQSELLTRRATTPARRPLAVFLDPDRHPHPHSPLERDLVTAVAVSLAEDDPP